MFSYVRFRLKGWRLGVDNLYQTLAERVAAWRDGGYPCEEYPIIAEVLEHQSEPEGEGLVSCATRNFAL